MKTYLYLHLQDLVLSLYVCKQVSTAIYIEIYTYMHFFIHVYNYLCILVYTRCCSILDRQPVFLPPVGAKILQSIWCRR